MRKPTSCIRTVTLSAFVPTPKYHEGGRPTLPTTTDGSVVDVEMPAKGYAPGPLKTIASMERKAKKIMTEPQNSDPEAAKNAFHRNHSSCVEFIFNVRKTEFIFPNEKCSSCDHQFPWSGCLTDCNRATITVRTPQQILCSGF